MWVRAGQRGVGGHRGSRLTTGWAPRQQASHLNDGLHGDADVAGCVVGREWSRVEVAAEAAGERPEHCEQKGRLRCAAATDDHMVFSNTLSSPSRLANCPAALKFPPVGQSCCSQRSRLRDEQNEHCIRISFTEGCS